MIVLLNTKRGCTYVAIWADMATSGEPYFYFAMHPQTILGNEGAAHEYSQQNMVAGLRN